MKNNILDIMYEPEKNRYSILRENGHRKNITKKEFYEILKSKEEKAKFTGEWSLFIGRWQPLHIGHIKLIREVLNNNGKVCIGIRNSKIDDKNPYNVKERIEMIKKVFNEEIKENRVKWVSLPDIKEICHGRKVGWGVTEIILDKKTEIA